MSADHHSISMAHDEEKEVLLKSKKTKSENVNGRFKNPWSTWHRPSLINLIRFFFTWIQGGRPSRQQLDENLPVVSYNQQPSPNKGVRITWIGHASVLAQLDGLSILTDPVLSDSCGPFTRFLSTKRYRPAMPRNVYELPHIDAVVISHNHYDHLDLPTVQALNQRFGANLYWFVPLGLKSWFTQTGVENVVECDWWQEVCIPSHSDVKFVFTPSQHWSFRTPWDYYKTLWGSWVVIGPKHKFFFAGDTGYCGVFKEIGHHYGPFDVAAIPIGAYIPRYCLSPQHVDPEQAVQIHKDVGAKQSVGIHWGTFALGRENYLAAPRDLKTALKKMDLSDKNFFTLKHGETKLLASGEGMNRETTVE